MKHARIVVVVAALAVASLPAAEGAARAGAWKGKATSADGTFNYGKVTFRKPVASSDQIIIVTGTISGPTAKAKFTAGPTYVGEGKFTAKPA